MRVGSRTSSCAAAMVIVALLAATGADAAKDADAEAEAASYPLVNGCFALQSSAGGFVKQATAGGYDDGARRSGGAETFRMQATALGRYLLYDRARHFLAAGDGDAIVAAGEPSRAADWRVLGGSDGYEIRNSATDRPLVRAPDGRIVQGAPGEQDGSISFAFIRADGCPDYPEVQLNATGKPIKGASPFTQTVGLADMHNHVSAFEFLGGLAHCGRPWSPYGAPDAVTDCPDHYPNGQAAVLENSFFGNPLRTHDPVGWPTFKDWPAHDSLTHEQTYYRWIERAWLGGERLMVSDLVENGVLCRVYPFKKNSCNEMDAVRLQAKRMYELQDYIDAQAGGPGKGFFRIVSNPFEARRVINDGKLAILLGIEVSELFGCTERLDVPQCTIDDVERGIKEVKDLGVSSFYPVHKFDNAFGGTRFDSGAFGAAINAAQFGLSGHFWQVGACPDGEADNPLATALPGASGAQANASQGAENGVLEAGMANFLDPPGLPSLSLPVYPPGPQCNVRGLTALGRQLIDRMIDNHLLVEVDHMSVAARDETLAILRDRAYSGVLSGHEWSDKHSYKEILDLGGMVGGRADDVEGFVADYERYSPMQSPKYFFGWGYGPDANGLGDLPKPSEDSNPVQYPFESLAGDVSFDRQVSGERTFDVNTDGTAHYGLLPDWFEDLRLADGGGNLTRDMLRGSEAYLETWERAYGVAPERCRSARARITRRGFGAMRINRPAFGILRKGGQPSLRRARSYRYCVRHGGRLLVGFNKRGRAALVAGSGRHHSAGPIGVGDRESELRGKATRISRGLWIERIQPGRLPFVYGTKAGLVTFAGVVSRRASHSTARLKQLLKPLR
ncbi:MAG: hypothetical protein ABIZ50_08520 [Solirubrobacterales bacterium]